MKVNNILEAIGHTPLLRLNKLFAATRPDVEVWVKLERSNPGGSIKDRIALAMIEQAEKDGILTPDSLIVEPTSGNTGVGLALVAAVKGYKITLVMPESMSIERRRLMAAYGAGLELTPREKGMKGAIEKAHEIVAATPGAWMPMQFNNPANVRIHAETTAQEILRDMPEGFDFHITGVGTGGHITGITEALKPLFPNMKTFAVEPEASPVISGGAPGPHPIQGIGAGFIPENLHTAILDGVIQITQAESYEMTRRAAREEGLFCGISSGASLAAVAKKLPDVPRGGRILTFCYDTGERYLSVDGLFV
ncbi:cysteine synthase A [Hymenobacter sp. PAMC 26628]|uniref:cysteine synthase A n=1 Tax=Hymenobacter sp. PAMC 26628 TaxID=1484118 RepID=UPI00077014CF|nr:cysteine synthase A [Hymenobacter sp. PAMC 26628]AMJ64745.1 cysteine synthase [Hymenobacter sp. PAMC 26628]